MPGLPNASVVMARALIDSDPAAALGHLEAVRVQPTTVHAARNVLGWRALALDRLGRHDEAAAVLRGLARYQVPEHQPLPQPMPAAGEPRAAAGTVLWSLPGVRIGLVHGRMAGKQKDTVMTAFKQGELDLLGFSQLLGLRRGEQQQTEVESVAEKQAAERRRDDDAGGAAHPATGGCAWPALPHQ